MNLSKHGPRLILGLLPIFWIGCASNPAPDAPAETKAGDLTYDGRLAPTLENIGDYTHPITTSDPTAQRFFDQGLAMTYAFNHAEAVRAFREAARIDPDCAMAHWGEALARGPNLNLQMSESEHVKARAAIKRALALKAGASQTEQDFIDALATRYSDDPKADRAKFNAAYADAMEALSTKYPDDDEAATLHAAALMNLSPWNYWTQEGGARANTEVAIAQFERVIGRNPDHAGSHHYYIHLVEASEDPQRGIPSADRLGPLMPAAGHVVHMPSHIYLRVGRYEDAAQSNRLAIDADEDYLTQCSQQGIYPVGYYPHNIHFLWESVSRLGRSEEAIATARKVASKATPEVMRAEPGRQRFFVTPYLALLRFGRWDEILAEPEPAENLIFARGIRHFARGLALCNQESIEEAEQELDALRAIADDPSLEGFGIGRTDGTHIMRIALHALAGEFEAASGDFDAAVAELDVSVRLEDGLPYSEPPLWHSPVRQRLGAVLLEAGRPAEAETVYWQDLRHNPENGWSLFGLAESLEAQGSDDEAREVRERFKSAWSQADIKIKASRF